MSKIYKYASIDSGLSLPENLINTTEILSLRII